MLGELEVHIEHWRLIHVDCVSVWRFGEHSWDDCWGRSGVVIVWVVMEVSVPFQPCPLSV